MSRNKTRTDNIDWLLGHGSDVSLSIGNKLPLQRAVMKRFLKLRQGEPRKSSRNLFTVILKELKAIWDRASIPIQPDKKCIDYLLKIHKAWQLVKKIKINSRESEYSKAQITDFNLRMDQLCDLSPSELEKQMSSSRNPNWEEDYNFYIGQKNVPQIGFMQGVDQKNEEKKRNKLKRHSRLSSSRLSASSFSSNASIEQISEILGDDSDEDTNRLDSTDLDYSINSRSSSRARSITLEITSKALIKGTGQTADARNLSHRDHLSIAAAFVQSAGLGTDTLKNYFR